MRGGRQKNWRERHNARLSVSCQALFSNSALTRYLTESNGQATDSAAQQSFTSIRGNHPLALIYSA